MRSASSSDRQREDLNRSTVSKSRSPRRRDSSSSRSPISSRYKSGVTNRRSRVHSPASSKRYRYENRRSPPFHSPARSAPYSRERQSERYPEQKKAPIIQTNKHLQDLQTKITPLTSISPYDTNTSVIKGPVPKGPFTTLKPLNRSLISPFLLRIFHKIDGEHDLSQFTIRGQEPIKDELQIYAWMDSKLREVVNLIKDVCEEARERNAVWKFRLIYPDKSGQNVIADMGTMHSTRIDPRVDNKTLQQLKFQIGDYIDLSIRILKPKIPKMNWAQSNPETVPKQNENANSLDDAKNQNEMLESKSQTHFESTASPIQNPDLSQS